MNLFIWQFLKSHSLLIEVCESSIELSNIKSLNVNTLMFQQAQQFGDGLPSKMRNKYCLLVTFNMDMDIMEAICCKCQVVLKSALMRIFYEYAKKLSLYSRLPSAFIKCAVF